MTLNGQNALCRIKDASFGAYSTMQSETKMYANDSGFWKYIGACGYLRRFLLPGALNESGVVDDGNFLAI